MDRENIFLGIGMIIVMCLFVLAQYVTAIQSDVFTTEEKGRYRLTWNLLQDYSNYKLYDVLIKNTNNTIGNFNIQAYLENTTADINIYEYKIVPTVKEVIGSSCKTYTVENGTLRDICTPTKSYIVVNESKYVKLNEIFTKRYGYTTIPETTSKQILDYNNKVVSESGTKKYRVEVKNIKSINYNAKLGIVDTTTGYLYHPMISSSEYNANYLTDNITGGSFIVNETYLDFRSPLLTGLLRDFSFDEDNVSGNTVYDLTNNFDATNNGADNTTGYINQSFEYIKANGDFVDLNSNPLVAGEGTFCGAYMDTNIGADDSLVFDFGGGFFRIADYDIVGGGGKKWTFRMNDGAGKEVSDTVPHGANSFDWVCATWNSSAIAIYVNGTLKNSLSPAGALGGTASDILIGQGNGVWWDGKIDEVRIWNYHIPQDLMTLSYTNNLKECLYPFNCVGNKVYNSSTFQTGTNYTNFLATYTATNTNCILNVTVDTVTYGNVSSGVAVSLSTTSTTNNTFNYTIECPSGSVFNQLIINFSYALSPPTVINNSCQSYGVCVDGVSPCIETGNTTLNSDEYLLSKRDISCSSFNTENFALFILLIIIAFFLILLGVKYNAVYGVLGSMFGAVVGWTIAWNWFNFSLLLILLFVGLTFFFVVLSLSQVLGLKN